MKSYVSVFELACIPLILGLIAVLCIASWRRGRILPVLWVLIGILSMSWVEPIFSNAMYTQFHPDFHRIPAWGTFALTQGQLPAMAPPGYAMYFLIPALVAVAIARRLVAKYSFSRVSTLLACGFVAGFLADLVMQVGQAQTLHLWAFSRAAPGLSIGSDLGLVPLSMPLTLACFVMAITYVLGSLTPEGDSVIDVWVDRHTSSATSRRWLKLVAYVGLCNGLYLLTYLPHAIVKYAGLLTQTGVLEPFPGQIDIQPESGAPQTHGLLGTVILLLVLTGTAALTIWWAQRSDRLLIAPAAQRATTPA